jgi:hypothetical protein
MRIGTNQRFNVSHIGNASGSDFDHARIDGMHPDRITAEDR